MSECMAIAEEKYPGEDVRAAKDIAQSILSEALHTVVVNADKDSSPIGDCTIREEWPEFLPCFPLNSSGSQEVVESCQDGEEKPKEYKVIMEQVLADKELRIENGQIHIEANGTKGVITLSREPKHQSTPVPTTPVEKIPAKEVNKSQSCVEGGSDKKVESSSENVLVVKSGQEKPKECRKEGAAGTKGEKSVECERPFTPFTTEDLRKSILQVWKNVNSPVLNGWEGELANQPQEVVKLMEELATIRVAADPNRPRACAFVEEDVKKMIRELEDMNFKSNPSGSEEIAEVTPEKACVFGAKEGANPAGVAEEIQPVICEVRGVPSGSALAFESEKFHESFGYDAKEKIFAVSLTESDEAFIEASESVIQTIEPQDDSNDENEEENKIAFSLLNELTNGRQQGKENVFPRYKSGMTTVGPIKNANYDPKILTAPEVDYGKMTRISGSCELKKESPLSSSSRRILLDNSDDSPAIYFDSGYMDFDTIVNHDIASLTKMQKVKGVLSDQPKSDDDLRNDEKFVRSPLDLKDVDADSCDSYNAIDIGIPLLAIGETNLTNQSNDANDSGCRNRVLNEDKNSEEEKPVKTTNDDTHVRVDEHLISSSFSQNKSVTQLTTGQSQKHNTISRVLQKASNRFIMKDSDSFLRNSRSLPRDTSKITNTESFRSLLDDCQTSAATVLKKSRSLLRNTQNALKAVSKTGFGHVVSGDKQVYAAPEISVEKTDSSTSSKKNDFFKLKDTIKSKVGKTLKSFENMKAGSDRKGDELDQSENQKKLSPKSPLVCGNQLPVPSGNRKLENSLTLLQDRRGEWFDKQEGTAMCDKEGNESPDKEIEVICGVKFQGTRRFSESNQDANLISSDRLNYVVMETIRDGIDQKRAEEVEMDPFEGAERPKSATGGGTESEKVPAEGKKSLTLPVDTAEVFEEFIGSEHLPNGKLRRKSKKFSARIRSFWQTAFGKVKTTAQKKDLS